MWYINSYLKSKCRDVPCMWLSLLLLLSGTTKTILHPSTWWFTLVLRLSYTDTLVLHIPELVIYTLDCWWWYILTCGIVLLDTSGYCCYITWQCLCRKPTILKFLSSPLLILNYPYPSPSSSSPLPRLICLHTKKEGEEKGKECEDLIYELSLISVR